MVQIGKEQSPDNSSSKELAKNFIIEILGEDPEKLEALTFDELMSIVAGLLKSDKQLLEEMFINYNDNSNTLAPHMIIALWKLINKGLLKNIKAPFGSMSMELWEMIKTQTALRMREMMEHGAQKEKDAVLQALKYPKISMEHIVRAMEYQLHFLSVANRPILTSMTPPQKTHVDDVNLAKKENAQIVRSHTGGQN